MAASNPMTVLVPEEENRRAVPSSSSIRVIPDLDVEKLRQMKDIFVVVSAGTLPNVAPKIRFLAEGHQLRVVFVQEEPNASWFPQLLEKADLMILKLIPKLMFYSDWEVPRRVMNAWRLEQQDNLIARAALVGDSLLVQTCALALFEFDVERVPFLRAIKPERRNTFQVAADGNYIRWPGTDTQVDLDTLRYFTDPEWRRSSADATLCDDVVEEDGLSSLSERVQGIGLALRECLRVSSLFHPKGPVLGQP